MEVTVPTQKTQCNGGNSTNIENSAMEVKVLIHRKHRAMEVTVLIHKKHGAMEVTVLIHRKHRAVE